MQKKLLKQSCKHKVLFTLLSHSFRMIGVNERDFRPPVPQSSGIKAKTNFGKGMT